MFPSIETALGLPGSRLGKPTNFRHGCGEAQLLTSYDTLEAVLKLCQHLKLWKHEKKTQKPKTFGECLIIRYNSRSEFAPEDSNEILCGIFEDMEAPP